MRDRVPDQSKVEVENRDALDGVFRGDAYVRSLGVTLLDWGGGWAKVRYEVGAWSQAWRDRH